MNSNYPDFQFVVNSCLLREFSKQKFIIEYAKHCYFSDEDLENEEKIRNNILTLLDWDKNGDTGLGVFCSKFESLKRKDLELLVQFIQDNSKEIIARDDRFYSEKKQLENTKFIKSEIEKKEDKKRERFCDENYTVSGVGKKARVTVYEGRVYQSRQECMYKEGLTKNQLYQYLKKHES